jgi:hypothetical protein
MQYLFRQSVAYVAGFDRPVLIPLGVLKDAVEAEGFKVLSAFECSGPLPFSTPTPCDEGWDYIALVSRVGPDKSFEVPSRVKWIVSLEPGSSNSEGSYRYSIPKLNLDYGKSESVSLGAVAAVGAITGALLMGLSKRRGP